MNLRSGRIYDPEKGAAGGARVDEPMDGPGKRQTRSSEPCGFLYALISAEYGPQVTKFGRTVDHRQRLHTYPKGSYYLDVYGPVEDCHAAERALLRRMRAAFAVAARREYFQVDAAAGLEAFQRFCYKSDGLCADLPAMAVPMDSD